MLCIFGTEPVFGAETVADYRPDDLVGPASGTLLFDGRARRSHQRLHITTQSAPSHIARRTPADSRAGYPADIAI